ncbi:MAG: hypothetical protein PHQ65_05840 [Bacteroidales bacterium]|nr:hypothetical protein [Bacteroidales bacterium]MDD3664765.1 hypothetical protein [Bacteroidales bacterium]
MKKHIQLFAIVALVAFPLITFSQPQPPNNNPGGGAPTPGNQVGGGAAPIGGGLALLLGLAAGYAGRAVYDAKKKLAE